MDINKTASDRIKELQAQIEREQQTINNCHHIWGDTEYDPGTKSVPYGRVFRYMGSDSYYEPEGYTQEPVPRWSRTCTICGKKEYTDKEETVQVIKKPKFN